MQTVIESRLVRLGAAAGMLGPGVLGVAIGVLTVVQYDFMRSLGWHPLYAAMTDWPSGLALGPHGNWMVAAFVVCGGLLPIFAAGLARSLTPRRASVVGPLLLGVAGVAMLLLAFKADPTNIPTPRTLAGAIHDGAFVLLGLSLLPGLLVLGLHFRHDPRWRRHARYTLATVALALPAFLLRGAAFYLFLLLVLAWFVATALRLGKDEV
ncbi:MAG: DUF998 domain-containing protein [Chloroflexaceae bacterium]|nr:DUF998 domain-containing protein [Chloroflexaceae bacterium]